MKTRRFAYLRHAALAGYIGSIVGVAAPAIAADSPLAQGIAQAIELYESASLQRATVQTPVYGARHVVGSPVYTHRIPAGAPAYIRPFRGYVLPRVWLTPSYFVTNWQQYNLARPAQGYGWSRYYDDAVLTDSNGRVFDTVQGVNWAAAAPAPGTVQQVYSPDYDPYNYDGDLLLGNDDVIHGTHWQQSYDDTAPGVDYDDAYNNDRAPAANYDPAYDAAFLDACRRDNGLGGAAIGAGVGGLAGNRIAGRGNRTGGTLIGAGVGAVAGMIIDKAEDRERCKQLLARETQGGAYGTSYAPPPPPPHHGGHHNAPPPPPPPGAYAGDYDARFLEACRRDNGLGGAAIGAGVGGLAGNRIAGRGNRTGGTLIGAGVGALAGMVIDKAEDRERCKQLLARYGAGYPPPPGQGGNYPPPPPGYYYYYPPPTVTTVTITPASCDCVEETVTTVVRPAHHPRPVHRSKNVRAYRK